MVANFQFEAHTKKGESIQRSLPSEPNNWATGSARAAVDVRRDSSYKSYGGKTNFLSFSLIAQRLRPFVRGRTEIEAAHAPSYTENSDMRRETGDAMKDIQSTRKRAH